MRLILHLCFAFSVRFPHRDGAASALELALEPLSRAWLGIQTVPHEDLAKTLRKMLCLIVYELKERHESQFDDWHVLNLLKKFAGAALPTELSVTEEHQIVTAIMPFVKQQIVVKKVEMEQEPNE